MQTVKPLIEVTPVAKAKLVEAMKEKNKEGALLRIGVARVGGCACSPEYQYFLSLRDAPEVEDVVEEVDGIKLAADRADAEFLRGAKLDYVESPEVSGFSIDNPNVVEGSCGCGGH
ncbi:MAG: iron-sulfur cluster assembly accessory protein [Nitrososphaerota archaeon]|jgi:iron-sulfur cluster assembly protein|nr:iron-sulfur cluster assembly accessory protein [Nitrososphaerota archaeon]